MTTSTRPRPSAAPAVTKPAASTTSSSSAAELQPVDRRRLRWLAVGTFALGTESLVIGGVLPEIADDLGVGLSMGALLVTSFAVTYAVAAPVMGVVMSRFAPKSVLTASMVLFVLFNLLAAAAPSIEWLMLARIATAITASMYTPNASALASAVSRPSERGQALAVVFVGLSLATIVGVPLGTLIAAIGSWRAIFVAVAGLGVIAGWEVARRLPEIPAQPRSDRRAWTPVLQSKPVWSILAVTMVFFAGQFVAFTLIAALISEIAGSAHITVPAGLFLFGIAGFVGNLASGRLTDTWGAERTARSAAAIMAVGTAALTPLTVFNLGNLGVWLGAASLIVWGLGGWALLPAQQARLLAAAPEAGPLVLAANSSALYTGTAIGAVIAALVVATVGLFAIGIVAAAITLIALSLIPSASR